MFILLSMDLTISYLWSVSKIVEKIISAIISSESLIILPQKHNINADFYCKVAMSRCTLQLRYKYHI